MNDAFEILGKGLKLPEEAAADSMVKEKKEHEKAASV